MKKAITIICTVSALLLILDSMNAANSILLFVFAGVIPGTNLLVSPSVMMTATAMAMVIVILRLTVWPIISVNITQAAKERSKRSTHRAI